MSDRRKHDIFEKLEEIEHSLRGDGKWDPKKNAGAGKRLWAVLGCLDLRIFQQGSHRTNLHFRKITGTEYGELVS